MNDLSAETLACFARIEQAPRDPSAWSDLLYALATGSGPRDVWAALPLSAQHGQNRIAHLMVLCRRLAEEGRDDILTLLSDGADAAFLPVPRYYRARRAYLFDADLDRARTLYERALADAPFATDFAGLKAEETAALLELLRRILFSLLGVQPLSYAEDAPAEAAPRPQWPELPDADLLIFAACDDRYCQSYASPFLTAIHQHAPEAAVLIHVMNPTAEGDALRQTLRREFPRCDFSNETCVAKIPFYAARRFMLANPVRHHYRTDLLILDIDAVVTPQFMTDLSTVRSSELALWRSLSLHSNDSGVYEAVVFAQAESKLADRVFTDADAWYRKTLARGGEFWCWDGFGLHYGLVRQGDERHRMMNLATLWPQLSLGASVLPQQRSHVPPGLEQAYGLFASVLDTLLPPLPARQAFCRLTGQEVFDV